MISPENDSNGFDIIDKSKSKDNSSDKGDQAMFYEQDKAKVDENDEKEEQTKEQIAEEESKED